MTLSMSILGWKSDIVILKTCQTIHLCTILQNPCLHHKESVLSHKFKYGTQFSKLLCSFILSQMIIKYIFSCCPYWLKKHAHVSQKSSIALLESGTSSQLRLRIFKHTIGVHGTMSAPGGTVLFFFSLSDTQDQIIQVCILWPMLY